MQVGNIFNKGGQVVPFTIKWQKYLDVDFTPNRNPFVIPFQTLTFWRGLWDRKTQNLRNASTLQDISTGVNFLESELTIEVFAAIRQRLLATNIPMSTGFNSKEDSYTELPETPQKMMWSKSFPWPQLYHEYMWRIRFAIDNPSAYNILMPGAQGQIHNIDICNANLST
jgi:hypothetical protein